MRAKRCDKNPILSPDLTNPWESLAVFNGSVIRDDQTYFMLYRAQEPTRLHQGVPISLSTIGITQSTDGILFKKRRQYITPEKEWEQFGCEDPRITKIDGMFYIFYTAISNFPPGPAGIKIGVALSPDLQTIQEKHLVTPFNAKAMALFPKKINGKYTVVFTAHSDSPPAKIAIAQSEKMEDFWNPEFWQNWHTSIDSYTIPIVRSPNDHIEIGAVPLETEKGWLLVYCHIQNYFSGNKIFRIDGLLLDLNDPQKVLGQTFSPYIVPEKEYELFGEVPNVVFPTGAVIQDDHLNIYYGAADTTVCMASLQLDAILDEFDTVSYQTNNVPKKTSSKLTRFTHNPMIVANPQNNWENRCAYNPTAFIYEDLIHILYRGQNTTDTSCVGYAQSRDGMLISLRLDEPIYTPKEPFEKKLHPGFSGCEDPRITLLGNTLHMCYTAYDGTNPPRVALTSILLSDFLKKTWNWQRAKIISPPLMDDKNACLFPEKIRQRFVFLHRINPHIWIDSVDSLDFPYYTWLGGHLLLSPRINSWDSEKVGIGGPPLQTPDGWILIYHGLSKQDRMYRLGAALLSLTDPYKVLSRLDEPILEPQANYEFSGLRPGTVFSCGNIVKNDTLFVYYGAADQYVCGASLPLSALVQSLKSAYNRYQ
jgi:beta-1,2-mannobiose phosphorylase / 1,2-beta-oligomannan phosphorylase